MFSNRVQLKDEQPLLKKSKQEKTMVVPSRESRNGIRSVGAILHRFMITFILYKPVWSTVIVLESFLGGVANVVGDNLVVLTGGVPAGEHDSFRLRQALQVMVEIFVVNIVNIGRSEKISIIRFH